MSLTISMTKASVTTAVCVASVAALASPGHAFQLKGAMNIDSNNSPPAVVRVSSIDFGGGVVNSATGDFTTLIGSNPTVQSILGLSAPSTNIGPISNFINFGSTTINGVTDTLVFNLTSATIESFALGTNDAFQFSIDVLGNFQFGETTKAVGILSAQSLGTDGWTINLRAEPIPTPALLPGLVGMGIAALKRKSSDESAEENA